MGKSHRLRELLLPEAGGGSPHPELGGAQIDCVGTVAHRSLQPLQIPGGSKDLRPFL